MASRCLLLLPWREPSPHSCYILGRHITLSVTLMGQVAVVSRGAAGSAARARCGARGASGAARVAVVDTVGAGDGHTAGFLHAYLAGASLEVRAAHLYQALMYCCCHTACLIARKVAHGREADAVVCSHIRAEGGCIRINRLWPKNGAAPSLPVCKRPHAHGSRAFCACSCALTQSCGSQACAACGCAVGAAAVQAAGAVLSADAWENVRKQVSGILAADRAAACAPSAAAYVLTSSTGLPPKQAAANHVEAVPV